MKPPVLQHGRLMASLERALAERFDLHGLWQEADPKAFLAAHGHRFVGLATSARFGADRALIEALPKLAVIASFGVGVDAIDLDAARERGVAVSNTPDVLTGCVADLAFGLLIDVGAAVNARITEGGGLGMSWPIVNRWRPSGACCHRWTTAPAE